MKRGAVVVTGASTGIGRACALAFAGAGFHVFAGVRDEAAARSLRTHAGSRLEPLFLDVTDAEQISRASATVHEALGEHPLVGLLNNAGITVNGPLELVTPDLLRRQLEVNVVGQLAVTRSFLPQLRRHRGRILFTGSVSGLFATPFLGPYCMSKYALEAMVDALRHELEPWGIRVCLLQPGAIQTPIWEKGRRDAEAFLAGIPVSARELYRERLEPVLRLVALAEGAAQPPQVVARAALHALTARRPKPRYLVGGKARIQRIVASLPTRMRDAVVRRLLELGRERRRRRRGWRDAC